MGKPIRPKLKKHVMLIQNLLNLHLSDDFSQIKVDGIWGPKSESAYMKFIEKLVSTSDLYNLSVNAAGEPSMKELIYIFSDSNNITPYTEQQKKVLIKIQEKLIYKRYEIGGEKGSFGIETKRAIRKFQNKMPNKERPKKSERGEIKPYIDKTWHDLMSDKNQINQSFKSPITTSSPEYSPSLAASVFIKAFEEKIPVDCIIEISKQFEGKAKKAVDKLGKRGYSHMFDAFMTLKKYKSKIQGKEAIDVLDKDDKEVIAHAREYFGMGGGYVTKLYKFIQKLNPDKDYRDYTEEDFAKFIYLIASRRRMNSFEKNGIVGTLCEVNEIKFPSILEKIDSLPCWLDINKELNIYYANRDKKEKDKVDKKYNYFQFEDTEYAYWGKKQALDALKAIDEEINKHDDNYKLKQKNNKNSKKITITGLSPKWGYRPLGITHKCGLDIDIRTITDDGQPGDSPKGDNKKAVSSNYNRDGQKVLLECIKQYNGVDNSKLTGLPRFGDKKINSLGLITLDTDGHTDHVHIQLKNPFKLKRK